MASWEEMKDDPQARKLLNHGFVALVDHMGSDETIVQSARVSYGKGTKSVNADRGLIRYLMRHRHTTPFEMVEFRFICKMPIFVARQWIRHRTANVNEYSGRYSVMVDEFYVPELEHILPQSKENHQGRSGEMSLQDQRAARQEIIKSNADCYDRYQRLLGESNDLEAHGFTGDFDGISREMARGVLSVNNYTEWYWKCDAKNLMHFLALRMDNHAQYEIQVFAKAMYELIEPYIPLTLEAFNDYGLLSNSISRMEIEAVTAIMQGQELDDQDLINLGMSKREVTEFKERFNI